MQDCGETSLPEIELPPKGQFKMEAAGSEAGQERKESVRDEGATITLEDDLTEEVKNSFKDVSIGSEKLFRRRRRHSHKRPSSGMTWQERREEARRRKAVARRKQSLGISVAPYNTTQFLMEEHKGEVDEDDFLQPRRKRGDSFNSVDSYGEDYMSSSFEDEEYLHAQFCAEYDSVTAERLHSMSKTELVHEYLLLEARIEHLEGELSVIKKAEENDQPMEVHATEEDIAKITVFQQEISKLVEENKRLQRENQRILRLTEVEDSNSVN